MDPKHEATSIHDQAAIIESLLPRLMRAVFRAPHDPLHDLPLGQLKVLRVLSEGSKTPSDIASELKISLSSVTQIVTRLEESGFVARSADSVDKRVKHIRLSDTGAQMMKERKRVRMNQLMAILETLSPEDRASTISAIQKMIEAGNAVHGADDASVDIFTAMESP